MFHLKLFMSQQAEENIYINKPQVWKYLVMPGGLNISLLNFFLSSFRDLKIDGLSQCPSMSSSIISRNYPIQG